MKQAGWLGWVLVLASAIPAVAVSKSPAAEIAQPRYRLSLNSLEPAEIVVPYRKYQMRGVDEQTGLRLMGVALAAMFDADTGELTLLSAAELDSSALARAAVPAAAERLEALGTMDLDGFAHEVELALQTRVPSRYLVKMPARGRPPALSPADGGPGLEGSAATQHFDAAGRAGEKATTTVLFQDFDNAANPPFGRFVRTTDTSGYSWGTTSCGPAHSGTLSVDGIRGGGAGLSCSSAYPNSLQTFMYDGSCEDLTGGATAAWLELYMSLVTEPSLDWLGVMFSETSDPVGQYWGFTYSGNFPSWSLQRLDLRNWYQLGDLTARNCNRLMLWFKSDSSITPGFGARVDDIHIYKETAAPSCPSVRIAQVDTSSSPSIKAIVSALDSAGSPIPSLGTANFCLREDGTSKPISVVPVSGSGTKLNLAINIDNSGSLGPTNFNLEKSAAKTLVDLLAAGDQVAVYGFADSVNLVVNFSSNKGAVKSAIDNYAYDGGQTALYDSIYESLSNTATTAGRKAVLAMTDGEDNTGVTTQSQVIDHARQLGIPIYTVGFGSANATVLNELAVQTGGRYYPSASAANLNQVLTDIGNNVNNQYQLSYTTTRLDGQQHAVEVCLNYAGCTVTDTTTITFPNGSGPCIPDATTLCIDDQFGDRRFKVQVTFATVQGGGLSGNGRAVPLSSVGINRGGLFWFFAADNPELLIKVLNACGVNGQFWMFSSAGTNVGTVVTVTDTRTGRQRVYSNADLTPVPTRQDTSAFSCN